MARLSGHSETRVFEPEVRLIDMTSNPIGTLITMWIGTRSNHRLDPKIVEDIYYERITEDPVYQETIDILCESYPEYTTQDNPKDSKSVIVNLLNVIVKSDLPLLDSINFVFEINNANVAWREQVVRSRRPQNFWTQSSRTMDLTTMDVNRLPSIESQGGAEAVEIYNHAVDVVRQAYIDLIKLGVSSEDIRLSTQGMLHRVYWMVPYRTLAFVFNKRISWIAQSSLWSPIIEGIQTELYKNCRYLANILGTPSDIKIENGKIVYYKYDTDNEDRYQGRDYQPCDPIWLLYKNRMMPEFTNLKLYDELKSSYIKLWSDEICEMLGWDKNNPEKLGYFDRPQKGE